MCEINKGVHRRQCEAEVNCVCACHLEDTGVDWSIILKWITKKWDGSMDWIDLVQNRGRWRALVKAVMNLRLS